MRVELVTCSYAPDLERCRVLCASVDRHVDGSMPHVLVVPKRDVPLFRPLTNERRRLVVAEGLLPPWLVRAPGSRRWWVTPFTPPVRGWIVQQLVKLSLPAATDAPVMVFADSDVVFVRGFSPADVVRGGDVRLYRRPGGGTKPFHARWHRAASRRLGLPMTDHHGSDYITQLVSWRRDHVLALQARIADVSDRDWRRTLCGTLHFSEYILYGVFVEHVLGGAPGHYYAAEELCHCSWHWHRRIEDQQQLAAFAQRLEPHHLAVLVQSNLGLPADSFQRAFRATCGDAAPEAPPAVAEAVG